MRWSGTGIWSSAGRALGCGLVLLAISVGFFAGTTIRQDRLLDHGVRVRAEVVHRAPAHSWDLFDNGRITVRYTTPQGTFERSIWLDDAAHAPAGDTWTVVYDPDAPGRVRSLADSNTPSNWGEPFLLVGIIGLVLLGRAFWLVRSPRTVRRFRELYPATAAVIPLGHRPRHGVVLVADGYVTLALPSVFGHVPMHIPIGDVVASDGTDRDPEAARLGRDWAWDPAPSLPALGATWPSPNLDLLFAHKIALPPLRRASDEDAGEVLVDGVRLRAADRAGTIAALRSAGVAVTDRPSLWLARRHRITRDPDKVRAAARAQRHQRWLRRAQWLVLPTWLLARFGHSWRLALPAIAVTAATFGMRAWSGRAEEHHDQGPHGPSPRIEA